MVAKSLFHRSVHRRVVAVVMATWFSLSPWWSASAQFPPAPAGGIPVVDIGAKIREEVYAQLKDSFGYNIQLALVNAMQSFGQRLAYETAVWIASGGPGQGSLLDKTSFGDFIAETAFNSGLEMIDTLDRYASTQLPGEWAFEGGFGVTNFICAPALPQVRLGIKLGLQNLLQPVQPRCTFKDIDANWSRLKQQVETTGFLSQVGVDFEGSGETDLGAALEAHTGIAEVVAQKALTKLNERISNKGFRPVSDFISENIKTPASVVEEKLIQDAVKYGPKNTQQVTDAVQGGLATIDTFGPMLWASVKGLLIQFGATLVSQTIQKQIIEKGLLSSFGSEAERPTAERSGSGTPPTSNAASARAFYAEFVKPRFASGGNYDQLAFFAACDPQRRTPTSCVIDQAFADAVRRNPPFTVAEAVAASALHDEWPLIPAGSAEDQQPDCSTKAYCGSNLAKLRAARIIPVGWEMVANHPANRRGAFVTFGDARNAFNRNGDDGVCGTNDPNESPYCGLIDPNWVLRYFDEQCLLRAPTELLADAGTNRRFQECRDLQSCLEKDADGRCVGRATDGSNYGYCVREQAVWRLGGKSCPEYAASCRAFTSRTEQPLAVLTSTIDRSQCSAGGVGCAWFASRRDAAGNWVPDRDQRYFNKEIERCAATAEGCSELIPLVTARTNLVPNGGFDRDTVGQAPSGWTTEGAVATFAVRENAPTADGPFLRCSGVLHGNAICRTQVASDGNAIPIPATDVLPDTRYTLTASIRVAVSAATPAQDRVRIGFQDQGGPTAWTEPCQIIVPAAERDGQWRTYRVTCTTGATIANPRIVVTDATNDAVVTTVDIDRVQLELGETPSPFHEGYAPDAPKRYLRVATPDLRCDDRNPDGTLNRGNDHSSCGSFATACTSDDVGCERYTPLDQSPVVLGRYTEADRCPAVCVGYAAFREVPSAFDDRQAFDFFIPSTARQCTATEAGCSEFTSIDASGRGGETRAYFTFLRQCRRPTDTDANAGTFYTWEGSGESGYQIRRFTLMADIAWQPPVGSTRATNDRPPFVVPDLRLTGGRGVRAANPQDTHDQTCERFSGQSPLLPNGTANPDYDAELTPDCRAFYTPRGSVDYRLLSRTVVITDACASYRLTHQVAPTLCAQGGGTVQQGACVYRGVASESAACAPVVNGCRAYRGASGGALRTVLAEDFETTVTGQPPPGWTGGTSSLESLLVGGHSMEVAAGATATYRLRDVRADITDAAICRGLGGVLGSANATGDWQAAATGTCAIPLLKPGATYEVLLVARGGVVQAELREGTAVLHTRQQVQAGATLGTTWQRTTVGPFVLGTADTPAQPPPPPTVNGSIALTVAGRTVHIDQIVLREAPTTVTVVKGSWVTPPMCDRASVAPDAAPQAQGMLGCRAYRDRAGQVATLRSFAKLCGEEVVGCTAFADTAGSSGTRAARTFANGPTAIDDITVPADTTRYLVDDPAKSCAATAKGCRRFGRPTLDRTQNRLGQIDPAAWADVYLRDDPDRYEGPNAILCPAEQLFCEEYRASGGTVAYFKNPGNRTCEYREKVDVGGGVLMDGWFRVGTAQACDRSFVIGGTSFGIWRNSDAAYDGWIGTCTAEHDQCTEFRDPADRSVAEPEGTRYFAIRPSLDLGRCTGGVSPAEGCVALNEVANPAKLWSAGVSNWESTTRQNDRVPAVDCDRNASQCQRCVLQSRCIRPDGTARPTSNPAGQRRCLQPNGTAAAAPATCTTDADCAAVAGAVCGVSLTCTTATECDATRQEVCSGGGRIGPTCTTDAACAAAPGVGGAYLCRRVPNDANVIVKVNRDRRCSQWYEKDGCVESFDQRVGRAALTCSSIRLTGIGGRSIPRPDPSYLTTRAYQRRDRSFQGEEYAGYAIPGRAGLEFMEQVVLRAANPATNQPEQRALVPVYCPARSTGAGGAPVCGDSDGSCVARTADQAACGPTIGGTRGVCYQGRCTYPPIAADPAAPPLAGFQLSGERSAEAPVCKAYPEEESPFPRDTQLGVLSAIEPRGNMSPLLRFAAQSFTAVIVCEDGGAACECKYQRAKYGCATMYFGFGRSVGAVGGIPQGMCAGGRFDGLPCNPDVRCSPAANCSRDETAGRLTCQVDALPGNGADGACQTIDRNDPVIGIDGYCLERDASVPIYGRDNPRLKACRLFYPVDQLEGSPDLNNQVQSAGYKLETETGRLYCVAARGNALPAANRLSTQGVSPILVRLVSTIRSFTDLPAIRTALYGTGTSEYWVAARLESLYTSPGLDPLCAAGAIGGFLIPGVGPSVASGVIGGCAAGGGISGNEEQKAIFTNGRGEGDSTGLEFHPFGTPLLYDDPAFGDGHPFLDGAEQGFWGLHQYLLHRDEIEKIVFRRTVSLPGRDRFNEDDSPVPPGSDLELQQGNNWTFCVEAGNVVAAGQDSSCWSTTVPATTPADQVALSDEIVRTGRGRFSDPVCEDDNAPKPDPNGERYYGAHAKFDANGIFKGLYTGYCHDVSTDDTFVSYDIFIVLREMCRDVRRVALDNGLAPAKPWTHRVWANGGYRISQLQYSYAWQGQPFGSANMSADPAAPSAPLLIPGNGVTSGVAGSPPFPAGRQYAGAPYACTIQCVDPSGGAGLSPRTPAIGEQRLHEVFANFLDGWEWQYANSGARSCVWGTPPPSTQPPNPAIGGSCTDDQRCQGTRGSCRPTGQSVCWLRPGEQVTAASFYTRFATACTNATQCQQAAVCSPANSADEQRRQGRCVTRTLQRVGGDLQTVEQVVGGGILCNLNDPQSCSQAQTGLALVTGGPCVSVSQCASGPAIGARCVDDQQCYFPTAQCSPPSAASQSGYTQVLPSDLRRLTWDISPSGLPGTTPGVPVVAAIGPCDATSGECLEIPTLDDTFAVNSINGRTDSGVVFQAGGRLRTRFQFFFRADPNQMPIRQVAVDYGDGSRYLPGAGSYQNRRGLKAVQQSGQWVPQATCVGGTYARQPCDPQANGRRCGDDPSRLCTTGTRGGPSVGIAQNLTCQVADTPNAATDGQCGRSECDGSDFGRSTSACTMQPFTLTHTYLCNPNALPDCTGPGNGPDLNQAAQMNGCRVRGYRASDGRTYADVCVYLPRVLVKDNWGYCATNFTGGCPNGPAYAGRGDAARCFDGSRLAAPNNDVNECTPTPQAPLLNPYPNPWVYFGQRNGRVIVAQ